MKLFSCFSLFKKISSVYISLTAKFTYLSLFLLLFACKDELLTQIPSSPSTYSDELINLPGIFAIDMISSSIVDTRADTQTPDGPIFEDGHENEYDLATPDGMEFYHYLILYKTNNSEAKPFVFPIDVSNSVKDPNISNNITLTVSRMFGNDNETLTGIKTIDEFRDLIKDTQPYVLLNFKLDESIATPGESGDYQTSNLSETYKKLLSLTKSLLETLKVDDYKVRSHKLIRDKQQQISNEETDFFTMSSSVYFDNNKKIFDGVIDENKIFESQQRAIENPALTVHVERLASKVTVSFNLASIGAADFDPSGNQQIIKGSEETNPKTGLPEFRLLVQETDMSCPGGIKSGNYGYEIITKDVKATIRILGYGLSNLETEEYLFKDTDYQLSDDNWEWNDPSNHRSYWARDLHYGLTGPSTYPFLGSKVQGYPHQFRLALDTDTIASYHRGLDKGYKNYVNYKDNNEIEDYQFETYNKLGEIDTDAVIDNAYLKYKSFQDLYAEFQKHLVTSITSDNASSISFTPFYSLENTYFDPGSLSPGNWLWPWQRSPYAAATNLIVLAEIEIDKNYDADELPTVYLDQNKNFYTKKVNLLNSKLAILNYVLKQGCTSGIQILNSRWDCHQPADNPNVPFDKVAWKPGSLLWFSEMITDENENLKYATEPWRVNIDISNDDNNWQDLDLIPAEISGGDGQMLIAPSQKYMGKGYRYYIAPVKLDEDGKEVMDEKQAVEISYNQLVALIHKIIGPIDVYTHGKMYFSVPVPHRISTLTSSNYNEAWKTFGAFSLVRNNWYNIEITEFTRLGTPVQMPSQPIIPVMDGKNINIDIKLKDWIHTSVNGWYQESSKEKW